MRRPILRLLLTAMLIAGTLPTVAFADVATPPSSAIAPRTGSVGGPNDTGRVIVQLKDDTDAADIDALGLDDAQLIAPETLLSEQATAGATAEQLATMLRRTGLVESADPDYLRRPAYTSYPNDPHFRDETEWWDSELDSMIDHAKSWALRGAGSANFDVVWPRLEPLMQRGWATTTDIKVGVIDTGFYLEHPDRGTNIVAGWDDCQTYRSSDGRLTSDGDVTPAPSHYFEFGPEDASHGTMTASEIGQATDNGIGGAGAAYDTMVRIYKVAGVHLDAPGAPEAVIPDSALIRAIRRAADQGCRVLSISLAEDDNSTALQSAVDYAFNKGCVIVAAAGNDGSGSISYPAACNNVIAVGAYGLRDGVPTRASFSNTGSALDIVAPGVQIHGPYWDDRDPFSPADYRWWSGTSMSTPYVASAAALMLRFRPALTPRLIERYLEKTSFPVSGSAVGGLDMAAAYDIMFETVPPVTSTDASGTHAGSLRVHLTATDAGSEVAETRYRIDGGTSRIGTSFTVGSTGDHTLAYWSIDNAGNAEEAKTATFTITPLSTSVAIRASVTSVRRGSPVRFTGSLMPARVDDHCRIYVKVPGSTRWTGLSNRYVSSVASTGRGGWASYRWTPRSKGRHYFRVAFGGDDTYLSRSRSISSTITVLVR